MEKEKDLVEINFTKENKESLEKLCTKFLLNNITIKGVLDTRINIVELLHNTTFNSLRTIYQNLSRVLESKEKLDRWSLNSYEQTQISNLKEQKELVDLVLGYKKWLEYKSKKASTIAKLEANLAKLEEENKTPEDRINETLAELKRLKGE